MATAPLTTNPRQTPLYRSPAVSVRPKMDGWTKLAFFLLAGYSMFGRAFAYIGIPPAKIFIGDVVLVLFLVFNQRALLDRWFRTLMNPTRLSPLSWTLLVSIMYGIIEVVYGVLAGNDAFTAIQILVFNLYPLYIFLGIWAGTARPDLLRKYIRLCAWFTAIYGPLCIVLLKKITITIPGTDVPILGLPGSGSGALFGLLCLEPNPAQFWFPIVMCGFMTLAMQVRADWVGLGVALFVWGLLGKKLGRISVMLGLVFGLLVIGFIADVHIYNPARGSDVSTREILGRAISAVDSDAGSDYTEHAGEYNGTVVWRERWWKAIREEVAQKKSTLLFGLGYGYPIKDLVPYLKGMDIRTPHSVLYFALGYSGLVGVAIFLTLQACVLRLLWLSYKATGQAFGIACWLSTLISAMFGNLFETPAGAIPMYILGGLCIAPALQRLVTAPGQPERFRQPVIVRRPERLAPARSF
jgi:hypothetical protein